jgi:hypothetical protein
MLIKITMKFQKKIANQDSFHNYLLLKILYIKKKSFFHLFNEIYCLNRIFLL